MANILFSVRSILGLLPNTEKIESKNQALKNEYNKLLEYSESDELKEFLNLEEYVKSDEFKNEKTKISSLKFKNSDEYNNEQNFLKLKKDKKIKNYFKVVNSNELSTFNELNTSDKINSFINIQEELNNETDSDLLKEKMSELKTLKKDSQIKFWAKYQKTKKYLLFKDVENSELLNEYHSLETIIESDEFKENKEYLLDKNKWQKTEAYQKEQRYNELLKSEDIKWFFSVKDSNKFDDIKSWNLTFEDSFESNSIDEEKWMNSFFWGKMLLNDRYVLTGDKHFYTDNKNIELTGNSLKIVTKQENTKGKVWNPTYGFSIQDFNYTSGMLTTAHSFRQKYGKFEAKIKLNSDSPVYQALWLKGEKILPEIDIFKFNMDKKNRFQMSSIWGDPNDYKSAQRVFEKINGAGLTKGFFIYTLIWNEDKITWYINNVEIFSTTENIPNEPLFIILSSGINKEVNSPLNHSEYEIEWIRCYGKVE
jgi:beta-glucanase (GH16 family)